MSTPWLGDACSLVDAFRASEISPLEALDDCIAAIQKSPLNAYSFTNFERAREAAAAADVSLPFGGVPFGIKELEKVAGWPFSEASVLFKDRVAGHDDTSVARLRRTGAVLAAQTTAPEFGGINCTSTVLHGTTRNPWNQERTPGGSSGGTAAAVVGGLLPIATGSDGGGSIRGPAGFSGLFGLKATYGRIPKGPDGTIEPMTTVLGCLTRSVRDTARYFDACNGFDQRDPLSLPKVAGWEAGLGTHDLTGRTAAIVVDLGIAQVRDEVAEVVVAAAERLAKGAGLRVVEVVPALPPLRGAWAMANQPPMVVDLGDAYPDRIEELSPEILMGLRSAQEHYTLERAASIERYRRQLNSAMADLFGQADFVFCSTHPDVAFAAEGPPPSTLPGRDLIHEVGFARAIMNNAALTAPSNLHGSPAVSIPGALVDGLPVGLQVLAGHHREELLLDLALVAEREMPWRLVAPGSPHTA
ncbi:MAG TPA: amidase [Acidimicrobiales bacterium]|jgi:aspartyl-tRNA(Asn)/glutamyl-tRNA(Gln) amidotransferase subunit A|nr:amidase [Acidimicrobiales bacterium]